MQKNKKVEAAKEIKLEIKKVRTGVRGGSFNSETWSSSG